MRIKLDRTICDGFMRCAEYSPSDFSLDEWGYASLVGNGDVPADRSDLVRRALMDCPVHAIVELPEVAGTPEPGSTAPA